jgi:nucleoside-diphosphate-sugar epimerase
MSRYNVLISGAAGGLGSAVHKRLRGTALVRGMSLDDVRIRAAQPFDAIVHCALNSSMPVTMQNCYGYLEDNFLLTQKLLDLRHRKFIYLSTLDIYPRLGRAIAEHEDVDLSSVVGPYAFVKLFSDIMTQVRTSNHLVLRTSTQLGSKMRRTVTLRLLTEPNCRIELSADSRYNYILQDDVVSFIQLALESDLRGIYNIASRGNVRLREIASSLGLTAQFGNKLYDIGPIDAARAAKLVPAFGRESRQTLNLFIESLGERFAGHGRLKRMPERNFG